MGCSPWGRTETDATERLHFHFSLSCTREGNSNPLQYSCLENPRDGGAWWAAIYGVAQSRTRLKRLSSSSKGRGRHSLVLNARISPTSSWTFSSNVFISYLNFLIFKMGDSQSKDFLSDVFVHFK